MDIARLALLTVLDLDGRPVVLGTLWSEHAVFLVYVRHYG